MPVTLSHARWLTVTLLLALSTGVRAGQDAAPPATAAEFRARGLDLGYNLDHSAALRAFDDAIAADPADPRNYCLAAGAAWISMVFAQGAITVDDYLGRTKSTGPRSQPDPALDAAFHKYLQQAISRSERNLREHPLDAEAHYEVGTAYGFLASYTATVQGRVFASLGPGRRAYQEHQRAMELDPSRKDAGLIVGLYRYTIAALSLPARMVARLAGFSGSRDAGLALVEDAARYPSNVQVNAMFTLILIYNRESRYDDALRVIETLQQRFPRNRLLWLEAADTNLRARRFRAAQAAVEQARSRMAGDNRPRAPGEDARWQDAYDRALKLGIRN